MEYLGKTYKLEYAESMGAACDRCSFRLNSDGCSNNSHLCGTEGYFVEVENAENTENKDETSVKGIKDDSGKTQWWYMDNFWKDLKEVIDVLTYGDSKYPAEDGANWRLLDKPNRRLGDALLRHIIAYRSGEKIDPETGKSHLAHAITNALMLMYFDRTQQSKE